MTRKLIFALGKVAVTVGIVLVTLVGMRSALKLVLCSEEFYPPSTSPDGSYVATVVEENCGATTGYVSYVDLRRVATGPLGDLAARAGAKKIGVVSDSARNVRLRWAGSQRLVIEYLRTPAAGISKRQERWRDITIEYRYPAVHTN